MSITHQALSGRSTALDLFAGVGGLSEGIRTGMPGLDVVVAVEFDERAAAGYKLNHPNARVFAGDIKEWVETAAIPQVDLVIGGPPCQGFSQLGKRDAWDERNSLWLQYAAAVRAAQPKYFVMENVPALLKSPEIDEFRAMTGPGGLLENYAFKAEILNAAEFGAPQVRKRVIIIGHRNDVAPVEHPSPSHPAGTWRNVRDAIGALGAPAAKYPPQRTVVGGKRVPGPFTARELHVTRNFTDKSLERFRDIPYGGNRFNIDPTRLAPCWIRHTSGSGDVMGRLRWEEPSVTIRTEFVKPEKGRYLHPELHRSLTPFEGALLQGFPEDYKFIGSMTDVVRQIGNAVPIALGAAIGQALSRALDSERAI